MSILLWPSKSATPELLDLSKEYPSTTQVTKGNHVLKNYIQELFLRGIKTGAVAAILAGTLSPLAANAQQITRVDASRMSCHALQDTIWARGAVIVKSRSPSSGMRLSERYVSDRGFCF